LLQEIAGNNLDDACAFARLIVQFAEEAQQNNADSQDPSDIVPALEALANTLVLANRTDDVAHTYRVLYKLAPATYGNSFLASLRKLGDKQATANRPRDVLMTRLECFGICCGTCAGRVHDKRTKNAEEFAHALIDSMRKLRDTLAGLCPVGEVSNVFNNVMANQSLFWDTHSWRLRLELVESLWRLVELLGKVGLIGEASTTSRRALHISCQLAHDDARLYSEHMISITLKYAKLCLSFGHADEAIPASQASIKFYRDNSTLTGFPVSVDLARSLWGLASILHAHGCTGDASYACWMAVSICQRLAEGKSDSFLTDLAESLRKRAESFGEPSDDDVDDHFDATKNQAGSSTFPIHRDKVKRASFTVMLRNILMRIRAKGTNRLIREARDSPFVCHPEDHAEGQMVRIRGRCKDL